MINAKANPVEWSSLLYELEDAKDHLEELIRSMSQSGEVDQEEFAIALGHIYAHVNRAWHSRDYQSEVEGEIRAAFSRYPSDLDPVG